MEHLVEERVEVRIRIHPGNRISRGDAARMLSVHPRTVISWQERGLLAPIRVGGRVFYDYDQVTNLASGRRT